MTADRRIPGHLRHLPRDPRTGWPVPHVNAWTSETDETAVTLGAWHGYPAFCAPESPGTGAADFTRQHMNRQRDIAGAGECQVCRTLRAPLLIVAPGISGAVAEVSGTVMALFSEPFICHRCATFALEHCPGLIRRRRDEQLQVIEPAEHYLIPSIGTHDHLPGARGVLWCKIGIPLARIADDIDVPLSTWKPT